MSSHTSRERVTNPDLDLHTMARNSWVIDDNDDALSISCHDSPPTPVSSTMVQYLPMDSKQTEDAAGQPFPTFISSTTSEFLPLNSKQKAFAEFVPMIDFQDYLRHRDPTQNYSIEYLDGFVNTTIRATKIIASELHKEFGDLAMDDSTFDLSQPKFSPPERTDEHTPGVRFPYHSLILKHSPPFVTLMGPEEPLSTYRQEVECKALALLGPGSRLETLASSYGINFPRVLSHDRYSNILIMSDIGNVPTLKDSLQSLKTMNDGRDKREIEKSFLQIGTSIGMFFAELHASSTIARVLPNELAEFTNDNAKEFNYSWKVEDLQWILPAAGVKDHSRLFKVIFSEWKEPAGSEVFANGNLTAESFLIQESRAIGLIGWQFAGPGRGLNGDMANLFAGIRVLMCDTDLANPKHIAAASMLQGIAMSYRRQFPVKWETSWNGTEGHWPHLEERGTEAMAILRSAFIVYGTALVVAAATEFDVCEYPVHPLDAMCSVRAAVGDEDDKPTVKEEPVCSVTSCSTGKVVNDEEDIKSVKGLPICSIRGHSIKGAVDAEDNIHSVKELHVCSVRGTLFHEGLGHVRWAGKNVDDFEDNWEIICKYGSPLLGFVASG